jgi:flagellar P-ring protein precursor FlgI
MTAAMNRVGIDASARDAGTVNVPISGAEDLVALIAQIENLRVVPDEVAKIVVNERNGTIVIGENVRISPVAVSYAGLDVIIGDMSLYSEGSSPDSLQDEGLYRSRAQASLDRKEGKLMLLGAGTTLSTLVRALNTIGASPKDMIAILQAMKKSGAIKAELEVI